jgi:hypothetical protein
MKQRKVTENSEPVRVYEKIKSHAEYCKIRIHNAPGGYSFSISVMVKWQGFGTPYMGGYPECVFDTEKSALAGAVKYIRSMTCCERNYTPEQKEIIEKMLPSIEQDEFNF